MKHNYEKSKIKRIAAATILALGAGALAGCQLSDDVNKTYYFNTVCEGKNAEPVIYYIRQYDSALNKKANVWVGCESKDPDKDLPISITLLKDDDSANVAIDVTYKNGFLETNEPKVETLGYEINFDTGTITSAQIIE